MSRIIITTRKPARAQRSKMSSPDVATARRKCKKHLLKYYFKCAAELQSYREFGILRGQHIRKAANHLTYLTDEYDRLRAVEEMFLWMTLTIALDINTAAYGAAIARYSKHMGEQRPWVDAPGEACAWPQAQAAAEQGNQANVPTIKREGKIEDKIAIERRLCKIKNEATLERRLRKIEALGKPSGMDASAFVDALRIIARRKSEAERKPKSKPAEEHTPLRRGVDKNGYLTQPVKR